MSGKFQSQFAMNSIRHADAVRNSMANRGLFVRSKHTSHVVCGCGVDGCVFEVDIGKYLPKKEAPKLPAKKIVLNKTK